jgi:GPI mannosyltransferase 3
LLVAGLYVAYWAHSQLREGTCLAAGALLGAVAALRIQVAPAVLVALVILWLRLPRRQWAFILLGAAVTCLVFGFVDMFTWTYPFASYVHSVSVNLLEGKSVSFGVLPWRWYGFALVVHVGWLLPFSALGARRSPFLASVAATVVVTHNVLAHKEYRFVYPAVVLLIVLGGLGIAEVVRQIERRPQPSVRAVVMVAIVLLAVAISTWKDVQNRAPYPGVLPAFQSLSRDATVCGVGLRGEWGWSGGYTYLHRDVPIVPLSSGEETALSSAFNVLVTTDQIPAHPATFTLDRCWQESCVYRRSGGCIPDPEHEINAYLSATGQ